MINELSIGNGFVKILDQLGDESSIVNAARVSFGKRITTLEDKDKKLLVYLAKHKHFSPFRHSSVQFHIKAPEFVARQIYKHVVGSSYSFNSEAWNEISGRYVTYDMEAWKPTVLRQKAANVKQGSLIEPIEYNDHWLQRYSVVSDACYKLYKELQDAGVCNEQARTILPVNFYTEWYWTASLQAVAHLVKLRTDPHAQLETQEFALAMDKMMRELYPNCWDTLLESI